MAGHNKWSSIKHRKGAQDAKRGKIFTRIAKEITIAAREGGGDPEFNATLRLAIDKGKAANMPKDNIDRAVKRGTGELEGGQLEEIMYEGYGPHGVGMIIECVTDNRNRSVAEVRSTLTKNGGNMATSGAVAWQFVRKGFIMVDGYEDEDELFMLAAEAGADDVQFDDGSASIFMEMDNFAAVRNEIQASGLNITEASLIYDPENPMDLNAKQSAQILALIDKLEDLDDVQNVFSALNITDEAIAEMG
ncbi:MAG: YebC/PmpR family DNA-binding transcriptional regulator [Chloroflexota bacterium]